MHLKYQTSSIIFYICLAALSFSGENSDLINFDPSVSQQIGIWEASASQTRYKTETIPSDTDALQRQNAENLKQIIPEKEYRGLSPNFHIHV
jgi:hypothetical protein